MESGISTISKEKIKVKKPKDYKVVMHNDDFTTMEFVVNILMTIFKKDINTSNKIMMDVHKIGRGIVGVYPYDIATTKVAIALGMAKEEGFPFNITIEEA
ncbi:MAG: ATP-dependent Clp protease adaptor ClpS [Clostridium celatum]|nr:ATP-dependent Clp protease adaptor ClpS [Clostridium celatum]